MLHNSNSPQMAQLPMLIRTQSCSLEIHSQSRKSKALLLKRNNSYKNISQVNRLLSSWHAHTDTHRHTHTHIYIYIYIYYKNNMKGIVSKTYHFALH